MSKNSGKWLLLAGWLGVGAPAALAVDPLPEIAVSSAWKAAAAKPGWWSSWWSLKTPPWPA